MKACKKRFLFFLAVVLIFGMGTFTGLAQEEFFIDLSSEEEQALEDTEEISFEEQESQETDLVESIEGEIPDLEAVETPEDAFVAVEIIEMDAAEERVVLDLSEGDLVITRTGYQMGEDAIAYQGPYHLVQTDSEYAGTVTVESGRHEIAVTDLTVVASAERVAAFFIAESADVTMHLNGTNSFSSGDYAAGIHLEASPSRSAKLTIEGNGTLYAYGGLNSAGIGGGFENKNGTVHIKDGTIYAYGNVLGAGIGGGGNSSSYKINDCSGGTIQITGGVITAVGGDSGAGIGGGNHGSGGDITISGGTIKLAQGGGGGAGIGSGLGSHVGADKGPGYYTGGNILLTGDYVIEKAIGGGNAAGIGGGMYCDSGKLVIKGGLIKLAQGGAGTEGEYHHGGAGIGTGYQGHCDITIKGAVIEKAIGDFSGAGIGTGGTAQAGKRPNPSVLKESNIFICSCYINLAQGGKYGGAGIGGGVSTDRITVTICGHIIVAKGGGAGAGIGSGYYHEDFKYASRTNLTLNLNCGEYDVEGGEDANSIGGGAGNEDGEIVIEDDEVDLGNIPNFAMPMATGYIGIYDGMSYSITVELDDVETILYSEEKDGEYTLENPKYSEVGEYTVHYKAKRKNVMFHGSAQVIITDTSQDGSSSGNSSYESSKQISEAVIKETSFPESSIEEVIEMVAFIPEVIPNEEILILNDEMQEKANPKTGDNTVQQFRYKVAIIVAAILLIICLKNRRRIYLP